MEIVQTVSALREARGKLVGRVGVVPTMGALHAGHMALVNAAKQQTDVTIATIFVNPTQFGPDEDLNSYPRQLERDLQQLENAGVDIVFTPSPDEMYPPKYQTYVDVEDVTLPLEGVHRPGHFRGVATVVLKLFNITQPHRAFFGQKDAQQVVVIKQMVRDLNVSVRVCVAPTIREYDGLALSSRNAYLSSEERAAAVVLNRALKAASAMYERGERHPDAIRQAMWDVLRAERLAAVDYVSVANPKTMAELEASTDEPMLASLTVRIGKPRLLDNMLLPAQLNTEQGLTQFLGVS